VSDERLAEQVVGLIADVLEIDRAALAGEPLFANHETWDSLRQLNLMLALEDRFDVEFLDRMLKRRTFQSISTLNEAINELLGTHAQHATDLPKAASDLRNVA
jgi:acyl carrier protein